jgi:acyl carrier protein
MKDRINKVLADVLMVDVELVNEDTSPLNLPQWDSLKQMNIIVALEEEFDIRLSDEDVVEMLNVKLIYAILDGYLSK